MVAFKVLALFSLLPALALGVSHDSRGHHNHVARRSRMAARAAAHVQPGSTGRRARSVKWAAKRSCRPQPEGDAPAALALIAEGDDQEGEESPDVPAAVEESAAQPSPADASAADSPSPSPAEEEVVSTTTAPNPEATPVS